MDFNPLKYEYVLGCRFTFPRFIKCSFDKQSTKVNLRQIPHDKRIELLVGFFSKSTWSSGRKFCRCNALYLDQVLLARERDPLQIKLNTAWKYLAIATGPKPCDETIFGPKSVSNFIFGSPNFHFLSAQCCLWRVWRLRVVVCHN